MAQSVQVQKVGWWHERLADYMIAFPHATLGEIAQAMGRSQAWISVVKNSDVFIDYWRRRSNSHSEAVTDGVKNKSFALVELAQEELLSRVDGEAAKLVPTETLLNIVDVNMKRFGYGPGPNGPQAPVFNFNLGAATPEQLAEARARLRAGATDVEALPRPPAAIAKPEDAA